MAYRSRKASLSLPLILILLAVLVGVIVLAVWLMGGEDEQLSSASVSNVSVESSSQAESEPDDPTGDIIFREGEGYDLLSVVNKNYLIAAADGQPNLVTLTDDVTAREGGDYQVDARVAEPLAQFLAAARGAGYIPILWSSYRTYDYQSRLYERAITEYMDEHPGVDRAEAVAGVTDVAPPGTSEHCTGLAVDIYTWKAHSKYGHLDREFGTDPMAQWMAENAHLYGFILRYPEDKEDITMITYEPWHFRYVGVEAATEIYQQRITLEEYTNHLGE